MTCIEKTYQVTAGSQLLGNLISTYLQIFNNTRSKGAGFKADAYRDRQQRRSGAAQLPTEHTGQAQFLWKSACPQAAPQRAIGRAWRMKPLLGSCANISCGDLLPDHLHPAMAVRLPPASA
jgi:hypothetical protein